MAEGILFNVAGEILMKLSSQAFQQLGMIRGVGDDLTKLASTVSAIKAVLLDAEERQTKSYSLKDWLEKLIEALYDADDVLDEFSTAALRREVMTRGKKAKEVRIFFSKSNQVASDYRMARKIKNVRERLDAIAAEKNKFHLTEIFEQKTQYGSFDQIRMRGETYSLSNEEVIGRDDDNKAIKDLLLDMNVKDNVSFIAIVGMGGIGKTTLARSLFNDKIVSDYFELKIWVCVSNQFDVKIVVEKIIESAIDSSPNVGGMESLQSQLQKVIGGKKYLLVMDDIWNESEEIWYELKDLLLGGARGSKIMITKRDSKLAAEIANMTSLLTLKGLSESDSWLLFRKVAFIGSKEPANLNMIQLGKEILVKCRGVPLVIRHVGRMLSSKISEEWMPFKNNELLEVIQPENNMTSILKLSYNHLPPNLKQCFAYSSLFPKNEPIKKDELIRQWVAQGFVQSPNGSKSMEDIGNDYFMELCWRFFYEKSGEHISNSDVNMHDVMHDLARMVAGNGYVHGNLNYDYVVGEKTRHVIFDHEIKSWWDLLPKLHKAEGLRTFLLSRYPNFEEQKEMNKAVLDELISSFPRLRVLDLKASNIKTVPDSIKKLMHLRYLDLSRNVDMELLPNSITELQNLQTLNLLRCSALKELPRDTNNLVNLRHLDIYGLNQLTHMPEGMGKLTCLQTLRLFVLDSNRHGSKLSELNELNDLRGQLNIIGLEQLRSTPSEASLANLKDKKGLRDLTLEWKPSLDEHEAQAGSIDEIVLEGLEPHPNVEFLSILRYSGVGLPNWISSPLLKLTRLVIVKCDRLQQLPQFNHLPALKNLSLRDITPLKFIDQNDPCSSSVFFPSLEELRLEYMPNLEGWWELGASTVGETEKNQLLPTFPRLTLLIISNCPKLASMPGHPSLKEVNLNSVGAQKVSTLGPLSNLETLVLAGIEDLEDLPKKLHQNLRPARTSDTSLQIRLQRLWISNCSNFMSLPDWIGDLASLSALNIFNCPKLKSLPEGMRQLKSLDYLRITGCPELEEKCKKGGEAWPKIAHVPDSNFFKGDEDVIDINTAQTSSGV